MNRINDGATNNALVRATYVQSINGELELLDKPNVQLHVLSQYRILDVKNNELYQGKPEQNLTNRIDYGFGLLKGAVSWSRFMKLVPD